MPAWHQRVPMSGRVEESETVQKMQVYICITPTISAIIGTS